jgi:hypothetical protein
LLKWRPEASPLEVVELIVAEEIVLVRVAELEDSLESVYAGLLEGVRCAIVQRSGGI